LAEQRTAARSLNLQSGNLDSRNLQSDGSADLQESEKEDGRQLPSDGVRRQNQWLKLRNAVLAAMIAGLTALLVIQAAHYGIQHRNFLRFRVFFVPGVVLNLKPRPLPLL
jgi:hypothetical protein